MSEPLMIPDHGDYRLHIRSQKPCPEISADDLNYYMSVGGSKAYYSGSISASIPNLSGNGSLTSPFQYV
jgi:hypothetical protein